MQRVVNVAHYAHEMSVTLSFCKCFHHNSLASLPYLTSLLIAHQNLLPYMCLRLGLVGMMCMLVT